METPGSQAEQASDNHGSHLVSVFELEAGDDLTLQLRVSRRLVQDGRTELGDVRLTGFPQNRVQPVVCTHKQVPHSRVDCVAHYRVGEGGGTCVLGDLSLGDHLFALGIHCLAVFVLLQTLENIFAICLGTEALKTTKQSFQLGCWSFAGALDTHQSAHTVSVYTNKVVREHTLNQGCQTLFCSGATFNPPDPKWAGTVT